MRQQSIFFKKFKFVFTRTFVVLSIFSLVNYAAIQVYAVYYPTDNITNPACAPGASGCYVTLNTLDQNIRIWNTTGHDTTSVGIGTLALDAITGTDHYNYAIGEESMRYATGGDNTALGWYTLRGDGITVNSGNRNVALGEAVLNKVQSGSDNVGVGNAAFNKLTTGSNNVAIGRSSSRNITTGNSNVSLGYASLLNNDSGIGNISIGYNSGTSLTTSSYNTFLGYGTGQLQTGGSYNLALGQNVDLPILTGSQQLNIGNLIYGTGIYGGAGSSSAPVVGGSIGIGSYSKLSRFTVTAPTDTANIGGTTDANASTTITGAGTTFTTSLGIGDRISLSSASGTYATVTAIASDTSLTVNTALGNGTSQTINLKKSIFRLDDALNSPKMVVNDLGNVGMGIANPSYQLQIVGSSPNVVLDRYSSDTTPGVFRSNKARGTFSSPTNVLANDGLVFLRGSGYNAGIPGFTDTASISIKAGEDYSTSNNRGSYISFATNPNNNVLTSSGGFERMRLSDLGNLGIGSYTKLSKLTVTAPTDTADIGGTTAANASTTITGVGTLFTTSLGIGDRISLSSASGTYATVTAIASDTSLTVDTALGNGTSQTISLKKSIFRVDDANNATQFVVRDDGKVGIGTSTPNTLATLHVSSSDSDHIFGAGGVTGFYRYGGNLPINTYSALGTKASPTQHTNGSVIGRYTVNAFNTGTTFTNVFRIATSASENHATTALGTSVKFEKTINGSNGMSSFMFADGANNLGIGVNQVTPLYTLHVGSGSVVGIVSRFQNSTGTCDINPTSTALSCSSDRTLKTNITNINNNILNNITSLQPVTYNWISDTTGPTQTGFIAQDVEAIFPSLVSTDSTTNLKSLNYIGLIPYAIEGIKELDIKLNQQSSLFNNDESRLQKIKDFFDNLFGNNKLCVDNDTCLTKEDVRSLLEIVHKNQNVIINQEVISSSENIPPVILENPTPPVVESSVGVEEQVIIN